MSGIDLRRPGVDRGWAQIGSPSGRANSDAVDNLLAHTLQDPRRLARTLVHSDASRQTLGELWPVTDDPDHPVAILAERLHCVRHFGQGVGIERAKPLIDE